jgi:hypothetical protein
VLPADRDSRRYRAGRTRALTAVRDHNFCSRIGEHKQRGGPVRLLVGVRVVRIVRPGQVLVDDRQG